MFTNKLKINKAMKGLIMLCFVAITQLVTAQQGINYKAILKDADGNVLSNSNMTVQFNIHQTTASGAVVYQEDHNYTTDANGLVILNIGTATTPTIGDFSTIDWGKYAHFLQTSITYSGGTINFDATEFMAVPYAKHAATAAVAENVFSGDYNDLINQPEASISGLEKITESTSIQGGQPIYGWRLKGTDPLNYGNIGYDAVDLSIQYEESNTTGATSDFAVAIGLETTASGESSIAMGSSSIASSTNAIAMGSNATASGENAISIGRITNASGDNAVAIGNTTQASKSSATAMGSNTFASGVASTAMGDNTNAYGSFSTAMGKKTTARSYAETVIGTYNTDYIPESDVSWNSNDRLFVIANGSGVSNQSNAVTVLKNGNVGVGTSTPLSLLEVAHKTGPPNSDFKNAFTIRNIDTNHSWQFYTATYLNLYKDGDFKGSWNSDSGAYVQASDRRVKKDIIALEDGMLNKVMQLNPVSYLMKTQTDTKRNLGLISQEVQEIFPSLTNYVKESDILALSYTELIPILIKALQEQQDIIDVQIEKNLIQDKSITAQNDTIKTLVARLDYIESKSSN